MRVNTKVGPLDIEGVWTEYEEGGKFRIARAGNSVFLKATDAAETPYRNQIQRGTLSTEKSIDLQCEAMAEGILTGWEGLLTEDDEPLEYSKENAYAVLRNNVELRVFIRDFATREENYRIKGIAKTAKK